MAQISSHDELRVRAFETPKMTEALYLLMALVFIVFSMWNGLYFEQSLLPTTMYCTFILIMGISWMKINRLKIIKWQITDYLVLSYFAIYFLSAMWPVHGEYAVLGIIHGISYLFYYIFLRVLISVNSKQELFINCLIVSGVLFAFFGLANGFGTLNSNGAIMDPQMRRLAGNFQYPNTFAIYQAIVYLLSVSMASYVAERSKKKFLYELVAYLTIISLILTYSRGTWLVLAAMLLLLIMLLPKELKGKVLLNSFIPIAMAVATLSPLSKATLGQKQLMGWSTVLIGMIGIILLTWITLMLQQRLTPKQWKIGTVTIGILVIAGAAVFISKHGLPQNFVQRLTSINMQQTSVVQRIQFYKDGLKVLKEHPILGAGPSAWESLWQRYQSYPYTSRQSHSVLIDQIMSVGIIGFSLFIALFVISLRKAYISHRSEHARNRLIAFALIISLLALLGHGAIDFDFSFGTINYLMWALIALSQPKLVIQQESILARKVQIPKFQRIIMITGMSLSMISLVVSIGYLLSDNYIRKAIAASKTPSLALRNVQTAVDLAPYRATAWLMLAQAEDTVYRQTNSTDLKNKIGYSAQNAVSLAPYDPDILSNAAILIGAYDDSLKAVDVMRRSWENGIYHIQYAQKYISYSESLSTNLYDRDRTQAKSTFLMTLNTYHNVERRIEGLKSLTPALRPEYPYSITSSMRLNAGEAAYYLGQWQEAERILSAVSNLKDANNQDKLKAQAILAAVAEKQGKKVDNGLLAQIQKDKQLLTYYNKLKNVNPLK